MQTAKFGQGHTSKAEIFDSALIETEGVENDRVSRPTNERELRFDEACPQHHGARNQSQVIDRLANNSEQHG